MTAAILSLVFCIVLVLFDVNLSFPNPTFKANKGLPVQLPFNVGFEWESRSRLNSSPVSQKENSSVDPNAISKYNESELQAKKVIRGSNTQTAKTINTMPGHGNKLNESFSYGVLSSVLGRSGENVFKLGNSKDMEESRKNTSKNDNLLRIFPTWIISLGKCRANCLENAMSNEVLLAVANEFPSSLSSDYQSTDQNRVNKWTEASDETFSECWSTCGLVYAHNLNVETEEMSLEIQSPKHTGDSSLTNEAEAERSTSICSEIATTYKPCLTGCQAACEFFRRSNTRKFGGEYSSETPHMNVEEEHLVSIEKTTARDEYLLKWPSSSPSVQSDFVIYSVVILDDDTKQWHIIANQTTGTSSFVKLSEENTKVENIRVLQVNSGGLEKILTLENQDSVFSPKEKMGNWNLRALSMINQDFIVSTEVTWDTPQNANDLPTPGTLSEFGYVLTWEVSGGAIKGNLITDSNLATISLWPDTVYMLQVGLLSEEERKVLLPSEESIPTLPPDGEPKVTMKSEPMVLNTSLAVGSSSTVTYSSVPQPPPSTSSSSSSPTQLHTKSKSNKARKYSVSPQASNVLRMSKDAREMKTIFSATAGLGENGDYSSHSKLSISSSSLYVLQPTARVKQTDENPVVPTEASFSRITPSASSSRSISPNNSSAYSGSSEELFQNSDRETEEQPFYWSNVNEAILAGSEYSSTSSYSDSLVPIIFIVLTIMLFILACIGYRILSLSILANLRNFTPKSLRVMTVSGVLSRFSSNTTDEQLLRGEGDNASLFGDSDDPEGDETFAQEVGKDDVPSVECSSSMKKY